MMTDPPEITLIESGEDAPRRVDALLNRAHILKTARELIARKGMSAMTMDRLAAAAGVGKGTLYRAFGTRAGLAAALLDEAEAELQERILTGPPPLGPSADPYERLVAFIGAYVDFLDEEVELLIETEKGEPAARLHTGAYSFWRAHVDQLLRKISAEHDPVLADIILAGLAADLYQHLREYLDAPQRGLINAIVRLLPTSPSGR